ncbi:MAG TPA: hypothetical protein VMU75_02070 [Acidimicrobiales bacterium]|nr:hypothetical protein [Acidimicrobiales bacterium]
MSNTNRTATGAEADGGHQPDAAALARLRDWAWERGRTDIVLDLDLHAAIQEFRCSPRWLNLVHLATVLPSGTGPAPVEEIRHLAAHGADDAACAALAAGLEPWSHSVRQRLAADLSEMAADSGAGGLCSDPG